MLFQTGLHWAAKHGHDDLIKMLAGTHKSDVNAKTVHKVFSFNFTWKTGQVIQLFISSANLRVINGKSRML